MSSIRLYIYKTALKQKYRKSSTSEKKSIICKLSGRTCSSKYVTKQMRSACLQVQPKDEVWEKGWVSVLTYYLSLYDRVVLSPCSGQFLIFSVVKTKVLLLRKFCRHKEILSLTTISSETKKDRS